MNQNETQGEAACKEAYLKYDCSHKVFRASPFGTFAVRANFAEEIIITQSMSVLVVVAGNNRRNDKAMCEECYAYPIADFHNGEFYGILLAADHCEDAI